MPKIAELNQALEVLTSNTATAPNTATAHSSEVEAAVFWIWVNPSYGRDLITEDAAIG